MRLNSSTAILFALSSFFCFGSPLPFFFTRANAPVFLERRASYSVVPVDGGQPAVTVVRTVVQTQAPVTIIETDNVTLPPVTNVVVTTKVVESPKTPQTILVTVTQDHATATEYSIIDVTPPPLTIIFSVPVAATPDSKSTGSSSSASKQIAAPSVPVYVKPTSSIVSSATLAPTTSSLRASPTKSATAIWEILPSASLPSPESLSSIVSSATLLSSTSKTLFSPQKSNASSAPTASVGSATLSSSRSLPSTFSTSYTDTTTSTTTYDNGKWHTHYPSWSNATRKNLETLPSLTPKRSDLAAEKSAMAGHGVPAFLKSFLNYLQS
ncbi:unnamed protein product [Diplocarpon coronariae]